MKAQGFGKARAPVRGTQSFVEVMAAVWKRPSLTAVEIAWRWAFAAVALAVVWGKVGTAAVQLFWEQMRVMLPLAVRGSFVWGVNGKVLARELPGPVAVLLVWACVAAVGRVMVMQRLDSRLKPQRATVALLGVMRVLVWAGLVGVWLAGLWKTWTVMVLGPVSRGAYPSYVPGFALVLFLTLGLFLAWCSVSWVLRLAAVLALARGLGFTESLRAAWRSGALRGKLIEINLVMGIVKVALLVLAMVFSACPLPFASVETQTFLACWWTGVGVAWLVMSDYFHVVRAAAYLELWRAYDFSSNSRAPEAEAAS